MSYDQPDRRWAAAVAGGLALAALGVVHGSAAGDATLADANDPELVALGQAVYAERCASCHGANLEGQPDWQRQLPDGGLPAPPQDASGHTWHHADPLLFEIIKRGGQAVAPAGFKSNMPGFGEQLTDREIWAVLAFIKSRWPDDIRARQVEITRASP